MNKILVGSIIVIAVIALIGMLVPDPPQEVAKVASEQKKPIPKEVVVPKKIVVPQVKKEETPMTVKEQAQQAVYESFNDQNGPDDDTIKYMKYEDSHLDVGIYTDMALLSPKDEILSRMMDSVEVIKDIEGVDSVYVQLYYPLKNKYGEKTYKEVITADFLKETLDRIQFDSFDTDSLPQVADLYQESPVLGK